MTIPIGRLGGILSAALVAYALVCVLAFLFQRSLIYFPWRWDEAAARRANPGYDEVRVRTLDGETLHAWLLRRPEARWTVVVFHGNGGNLSVQEGLMAPFRELDLQALIFDYRGFGLSTGKPTQEGLLRDGEAVVDFVTNELRVPPENVVYFGKSLGSSVAVLLASRRPPARLILESSYGSLASVARHHYSYLPVSLLLRDRYDAASAIGELSCPVLFFHPAEDEITPIHLGRALFERARQPKRFVPIPGAHHNDPPESFPSVHLEALREFLRVPPP